MSPSRGTARLPPRSLTPEERRRLFAFVDADVAVGTKLPDFIRFAIGSGLWISELCTVRWVDLNLGGIPAVPEGDMIMVPVVAVRQNVYPVKARACRARWQDRHRSAYRALARTGHHPAARPPSRSMTPHTLQRTYATILGDEMALTDQAKADLMGQASS